MRIDLHIHSTASDGAHGPREIVARARGAGLHVIALADHDTTAGVPEALAVAGTHVQVIPALEISAAHAGRDLHVLGYFVDLAAPALVRYVERARGVRQERMREMIGRLATLDVVVDFDEVMAEAGPDAESLARPHLARVLMAAGHVATVSEAFDRYIGDEGPAFVPARMLDVAGAIRLIHEAGGLAVWAHPPTALVDMALPAFVEAGLDGVECYRPRLQEAELHRLLQRARRHGLVVTGGSDWHGEWQGDLGSFYLQSDQVREFLERGGLL
jgi:3',5'-nucleoside bisphosphate phosphatase